MGARESGDGGRRPHRLRAVAEFAVVLTLSLVTLFIVIPAGTVESDNFGLSPQMLPIGAVVVIAVMSAVTFIVDLVAPGSVPMPPSRGLSGVLLLMLATLVGVLSIERLGVIAGGAGLVVLASLSVGERRPLWIIGAGLGACAVLILVVWSGL